MSKLITLGCSVTAHPGLKEKLSELLKIPNLNLAYPAGSNQLQIARLMELLVNNRINQDDIIYWQITSNGRNFLRLKLDQEKEVEKIQKSKPYHHYTISEYENIFDKEKRLDILCISPITRHLIDKFDPEEETQKLLGTMILLKKFCDRMIVVFGWKEVLASGQEDIYKQILDSYGIDYIDEHYVDYAKERGLLMCDDMHPSHQAGINYAEEIIFKKMKSLGWV